AEWSSSLMPSAAVPQTGSRRHTRKQSLQPMSRRVDPANPSLETHHLAGDPETRFGKAPDGDRLPPATHVSGKRIISSEPRIVGRIAGSAGLQPAHSTPPPPRWKPADQPLEPPSAPGDDSGGPRQATSRRWHFWHHPKSEPSDEATDAPGGDDSGTRDTA